MPKQDVEIAMEVNVSTAKQTKLRSNEILNNINDEKSDKTKKEVILIFKYIFTQYSYFIYLFIYLQNNGLNISPKSNKHNNIKIEKADTKVSPKKVSFKIF